MLQRIQLLKSLNSIAQMQSVGYSSGVSKNQLIRIRADQKKLYGRIIRGNAQQSAEIVENKEERKEGNVSIVNTTADFKASTSSQASEFYWLIQRGGNKNVKVFRSNDVEIDKDVSTKDKFNESSSLDKTS